MVASRSQRKRRTLGLRQALGTRLRRTALGRARVDPVVPQTPRRDEEAAMPRQRALNSLLLREVDVTAGFLVEVTAGFRLPRIAVAKLGTMGVFDGGGQGIGVAGIAQRNG